LVGRRSKIVDIRDDDDGHRRIYSRLVDDKGNFIDDTTWNGDYQSGTTYIFEPNEHIGSLRHSFLKEDKDEF